MLSPDTSLGQEVLLFIELTIFFSFKRIFADLKIGESFIIGLEQIMISFASPPDTQLPNNLSLQRRILLNAHNPAFDPLMLVNNSSHLFFLVLLLLFAGRVCVLNHLEVHNRILESSIHVVPLSD